MKKKYYLILLLLLILNMGCSKSELKEEFQCEINSTVTGSKTYTDVMKHFSIDIPKGWKTTLYYDQYISEIFSADTTRGLSKSYIVDLTWHQGDLTFDREFEGKISKNLDSLNLKTDRTGYLKFKKYPAYYNVSKGKFKEYDYSFLQVYVISRPDEYFTFTSKVYGNEAVDERICKSIELFEKVKILN